MDTPGNSRRKTDVPTGSLAADGGAFVSEIGRLVRLGRAKRGISRRKLADASGISERYLAQIEAGKGNPSAIVLRSVAEAIGVSIVDLLPRNGPHGAARARIHDLVARAPAADLAELAGMIERRLAPPPEADRGRRIALIGLRGAGKSTLGAMLAKELGFPFIELNRVIEQEYGARLPLLIEMAGVSTFRRYERTCLESVVERHEAAVIATSGGIVANPDTYALLLRATHVVWIKARPEDHMRRVMAQGDFRPMAQNREAMADLHAILEARGDDYARAKLTLDTSRDTLAATFKKLTRLVAPIVSERPRGGSNGAR